jgi:Xaa-Pro dipeptidase
MMKPDFRRRLSRLREAMSSEGLPACLITGTDDIYYLTGKEVVEGDPAFLTVTKKTVTLFISSLDNRLEGPGVRTFTKLSEVRNEFRGSSGIGFDERGMSVYLYRKLGRGPWKPFSGPLKAIRMVKDGYEIEQMRSAAGSIVRIIRSLEPQGKSEFEVAASIHGKIRSEGNLPAFEPIVAGGPNSANVHHIPGPNRITRGLVIVDAGVRHNHYNSDVTRTLAISPSREEESMLEQCRQIQSDLIDMVTPGTEFAAIQKRFQMLVEASGYKLMHSFGHGIGLREHERPGDKDVLERGMVLTVEPGIYKKGVGGCRVEDMVLVAGAKPVLLSR